jgi:adenylate cyclase
MGLNSTIQEIFFQGADRAKAGGCAGGGCGLMGDNEEGTLVRLKEVRKALVDPIVAAHRGRIVKTTGDGMLVKFSSAVDAARCATEVQHGMAVQNSEVPQDLRIEFRICIHVATLSSTTTIFSETVSTSPRV